MAIKKSIKLFTSKMKKITWNPDLWSYWLNNLYEIKDPLSLKDPNHFNLNSKQGRKSSNGMIDLGILLWTQNTCYQNLKFGPNKGTFTDSR